MKQVDIADLDCIFLTYDEPQKEEFWVKIKNMVPWAKRVDGVKGSDAAHKAAAQASDTARFILIDGDNLPDPSFFNQTLDFIACISNTGFPTFTLYRWLVLPLQKMHQKVHQMTKNTTLFALSHILHLIN